MASPGFVKKCSDSDELVSTWGKWIDTMVLYKLFFKNISDYSLENLIDEFELTSKLLTVASNFCPMHKLGYHSAIFDALATCLLLKNLATELKRRSIRTSEMFLLECSNNS
jgi:DNA polymerase III epsilon subunit-like protein